MYEGVQVSAHGRKQHSSDGGGRTRATGLCLLGVCGPLDGAGVPWGYTLARKASRSITPATAALEHGLEHVQPNKSFHKPLIHIQQTVNIVRIEHVYRYGTLLLGVPVCLGGVCIHTQVSLRLTFVGGCVPDGR